MRKHILLGAALLSLMATSCSNDDVIDNGTEVVTGKAITLNATINNGADTRMTYTDDADNKKMTVAWSSKESFTMYKGTNGTGSTFTNSADNTGKFKGDDITGEGTYYAVYGDNISNADGTLTIDLSGDQVGTNAENGIKEFMLASADALTSSTTLTFNHKLTVLKMTLTLPSDVTGTVNKVTVSGLHNKASYTLSDGSYAYADDNKGDITATNGTTGFAIGSDHTITAYVAVFPENVSANQVTIKATMGDNDYAYTITSARTLTAGKVTPVTVPMTKVLNCASGNLTNEAVKAAIVNNNLIISSDADLTANDFSVLRSVLTNGSYTDGTINLTLLNQTSLPGSLFTGALDKCSALKSVFAPKVTSVETYAFFQCTSLSSVELPKVTSMGQYAFQECSNLMSVSLPEATSVGMGAFYQCTSLTSVSLPKVTSVVNFAFSHCTSLSSVSLPQATSVGENAFYGCTKSNIDLTVKDGTTWWGSESDWKSVTIIKVNFKSEYTKEDYKTWSEDNCGSAPTYDDMCMYLGAGVYWDNGTEGENQQTYTVNGSEYHTGLWVMKKEYISGFSAGTAKAVTKVSSSKNSDCWNVGRPKNINKYFFLPAAGRYYNGGFGGAGSYGLYWSSSRVDDDNAYSLYFVSSRADVDDDGRDSGYLPMVPE